MNESLSSCTMKNPLIVESNTKGVMDHTSSQICDVSIRDAEKRAIPCISENKYDPPPIQSLAELSLKEEEPSTTINCFAVLKNNGREVDLFDAHGKHKTFSMVSPPSFESDKICFSSHGLMGKDGIPVDGLLTPCFDEHGLHISMDDSKVTNRKSSESSSTVDMECVVCDVKKAHLHAHIHDPVKCSMDYSSRSSSTTTTITVDDRKVDDSQNQNQKQTTSDLNFLASLTFIESDKNHAGEKHHKLLSDPNLHEKTCDNVNDPLYCAYDHVHAHDNVTHLNLQVPKTNRHEKFDTSQYHEHHSHSREGNSHSHSHLHEDLHLEEDLDDDSHQHDHSHSIHLPITESLPKQCNSKEYSKTFSELDGRTSILRERRVLSKVQHEDHIDTLVHNNRTGNLVLEHACHTCGDNDIHGKFDLVGTRNVRKSTEKVHLHFFELPTKPFRIVDLLSDVFSLNSPDRVAAIRDMSSCIQRNQRPPPSSVASFRTFPKNVQRSDPSLVFTEDESSETFPFALKQSSCCAYGICGVKSFIPEEILNTSLPSFRSLPPTSTKDRHDLGGSNSTHVRSQFFVQGICCSSETKQILAILEPVDGIHSVRVNAQLKSVVVDHDPTKVQAAQVQKILNREKFSARITEDGQLTANVSRSASIPNDESDHITTQHEKDTYANESRKRSQFFVENICCAAEIRPIRGIIESLEGVHEVSINVTTKMVYVRHDVSMVSASEIESRLNKEGFRSQILFDAAEVPKAMTAVELECTPQTSVTTIESIEESVELHASKLNPLIVISGLFWIISMLSYIGGHWLYLKYLGIVSVVCSSPPIAMKAFRTLYRRQFDVNCMMLLAIIGAVALQDFEEAAAVAFLFSISEWLETKATSRARIALSTIVSLRPDFADVIDDQKGRIVRVPASAVLVGAKLSVRQGDKIPCDGVVVQGSTSVNESSITGESRPIQKKTGDNVSGGTINCGLSQIVVLVTATVDDSAVSKLIRLVEDAQMNRSPTEMMVDTFAKHYTPFVVLLSLCMITIPWAWGKAVGQLWMKHGLITIVLACPCALVISTPVTYVAALAATAQKGILVKGGAFLEALGRIRQVCIDKTGTLTEGNFSLDFFEVIGSQLSRTQVLEYLASAEGLSSHPIAVALVAAAQNEGIDVKKAALISRNHTNIEGLGVSAVVNGATVYVGNMELFRRLGLFDDYPTSGFTPSDSFITNNADEPQSSSRGYILISGYGIVGTYSVSDKVRNEAKSVVSSLLESGITVHMLTGDNHKAAQHIGQHVGIDSDCIKSQLLPQEKLDFIRKMKDGEFLQTSKGSFLHCFDRKFRRGLVLMVGDGVNDGPALAAADVGVSMGRAAALAIETSDITLMDSNLEKLLYGLNMGRRVRMVILQNIIFSVCTKAIVVVLVFVGYGSLWLAISSDVVAMLLVTANGMRLLPSSRMVSEMKFELSDTILPPV